MRPRSRRVLRRAVTLLLPLLLPLLVTATAAARAPSAARGKTLRGVVIKVRDGDSMVLRIGNANVGVRVFGVDCPERGQPFAARAKSFTSGLVGNAEVSVLVHDVDRYGRFVGDVRLAGGRSLAHELLREGLAWYYRRYAHDPELERLESDARTARRGLWSDPRPVPPWKFRAG